MARGCRDTMGGENGWVGEGRLDAVVLGATGFTGRYIAAELWRVAQQLRLRVGVAGRDTGRLRQLQLPADVQLLQTDIASVVSLDRLCARTRLLINATGPFYQLGEPVIRACIRAGTHYLDICGERLFIERCQLQLGELAERSRCYCVSTCGFDSIPAELGSLVLERAMAGGLNGLHCYLQLTPGPGGYDGVHMGTWVSSIHGTASELQVALLQRKLNAGRPLPKTRHRMSSRGLLHRAGALKRVWCLPFPGPDVSVHARSQRILRRADGHAAVQMHQYVAVGSWWRALLYVAAAVLFGVLCYVPGGRRLLLAFPALFSAGLISRRGPRPDQVSTARFHVVCQGEGWRGQDSRRQGPPDLRMTARLQFPEAAYATTALCIVQCAVCVLLETDSMPGQGGVLPPGAAFANTTLLERLRRNGVTVSVETNKQ